MKSTALSDPRMRTFLLCAIAALLMFSRLGDGRLANFDDCYYAEKAKEMLQAGDWLTPHFAGNVRLDNPPLFLWIIAGGFRLFGVSDYGASFFSALAGVLCIPLLIRIARRIGFDAFGAFCAGVVLLTTQYFLKYAQHAMMDVILTLLFLLAVDGYLTGEEGRRRGFVQLGLATGLGVLMKSVLGLFPLVVVAIHRLIFRRARALTDPGLWIAGAIALAVSAPWFVFQFFHHHDQLLDEHIRWLLFRRGLIEPGYGGFANDLFGYPQRIASVYWPWLPFALAGIWFACARASDRSAEKEARSSASLVLLWLSVVIGIMSLGHVKKLWYVMSVFPCLALLSSVAVGRMLKSTVSRERAAAWSMAVVGVFAGIVALTPFGPARPRQPDLQAMTSIVRANVPAGQKVLNLDAPYWELANQFLFYSNHDLTEPLTDPALVREGVRRGGWALIATARVPEILGDGAATISVVARSGAWALLTAAPAAPLNVPPVDASP